MTGLACDACGRGLGGETAFCPFCGADRRAPPQERSAPRVAETVNAPATAVFRSDATASPPQGPALAPKAAPSPTPITSVPTAPASAPGGETAGPAAPAILPRRRSGCGLPLLLALMVLAGAVAWWAVRPGASRGALPVAGAVASRPLHVTRRWRRVRLPDDAPADARFALSSDAVVRVRAAGRLYAVRPGHPLRLPGDTGDSFELRAPDYLSADAAARTQVTLSTLPPP